MTISGFGFKSYKVGNLKGWILGYQ